MDKLTAIKIKYDDGTYSDEIPVSVLSENVEWDSTHTLVDVLGSIDVDVTGTIQDQISQLFNEKVSNSQMQNYISSSMPSYITNWLNQNVDPVGSAVVVDKSLSVEGAAADAKVTGNKITNCQSQNTNLSNLYLIQSDATVQSDWLLNRYKNLETNILTPATGYATVHRYNLTTTRKAATMTNSNYEFAINTYSVSSGPSSASLIKGYGWYSANTIITFPAEAQSIVCQVKKIDQTEITNQDLPSIISSFKFFIPTDETLTLSGKPADAKATKEAIEDAVNTESAHRQELEQILKITKKQVPIDYSITLGTEQYPLGWMAGYYDPSTGQPFSGSHRFIRTVTGEGNEIIAPRGAQSLQAIAPEGRYIAVCEYDKNGIFIKRHGKPNNSEGDGTNSVNILVTEGFIYKLYVGFAPAEEDSGQWINSDFINNIKFTFNVSTFSNDSSDYNVLIGDLSNYTIVCAKESNYNDGTAPSVDWYLIQSPDREFFITKDFYSGRLIFTADYDAGYYKYGVLKNGDIIAVYRIEHISTGSDESNRQNPFVYLASENWKIKHTVDFGDSLKPCGWLENCGFCSMPNGDVMFCEYTRPSVVTANCWKIHGDATDPASWTIVKSFQLSGLANEGFKHCHSINYDFYNDVYYLTTGDDDIGAQVWYSTDNGVTWTLSRESSEKYCRVLNMVFTPEYIYWASDTTKADMHYLFRCARTTDGIIDYSTVTELADLYMSGIATYGLVFIEEYNAIVILDKADSARPSVPFRIYDINNNTLYTMETFFTADGTNQQIGFRTEYTEFIPDGPYVLCGFGKKFGLATYRNFIKGLGNAGDPKGWISNVNNLRIKIFKTNNGYRYKIKTAFMPR